MDIDISSTCILAYLLFRYTKMINSIVISVFVAVVLDLAFSLLFVKSFARAYVFVLLRLFCFAHIFADDIYRIGPDDGVQGKVRGRIRMRRPVLVGR